MHTSDLERVDPLHFENLDQWLCRVCTFPGVSWFMNAHFESFQLTNAVQLGR